MRRTPPDRVLRHYRRAKRAGLTFPLGRALYLENRLQNEGGSFLEGRYGGLRHPEARTPEAAMKNIKPETAKRWLEHWGKGGHIRALSLSVTARNERRRWDAKQVRDRYPEGQPKRGVFALALRKMGFEKQNYTEPHTFEKQLEDRRLDVQLWDDGMLRISHYHGPDSGRMNTRPSHFKTLEGMEKAIKYETDRDHETDIDEEHNFD